LHDRWIHYRLRTALVDVKATKLRKVGTDPASGQRRGSQSHGVWGRGLARRRWVDWTWFVDVSDVKQSTSYSSDGGGLGWSETRRERRRHSPEYIHFFAAALPGLLTCPAEVGGGEGVKEIVTGCYEMPRIDPGAQAN
jgi:hypothetical protein